MRAGNYCERFFEIQHDQFLFDESGWGRSGGGGAVECTM